MFSITLYACDTRFKGDCVDEVCVANKARLVCIRPKIVIDCTGSQMWPSGPGPQPVKWQSCNL